MGKGAEVKKEEVKDKEEKQKTEEVKRNANNEPFIKEQ